MARLPFIPAGMLALVLLLPGTGARANCTASTQCSYGSASCSRDCTNAICISHCVCNAFEVSCACSCFYVQIETDFENPSLAPLDRVDSGHSVAMADDVTVKAVAILIHMAGWGVNIVGNEDATVAAGTFEGTMTDIVATLGNANGFTASWNDTTQVLTLTVN